MKVLTHMVGGGGAHVVVFHSDPEAALAQRLNACLLPQPGHPVFAAGNALGLQLLPGLECPVAAAAGLMHTLNVAQQLPVSRVAY